MVLTTHALTGAVIGKNLTNLPLIILLSLAIHFTMDSFRHGEYFDSRIAKIKDTWWKIALDLSIGFFIIISFIYFKKPIPQETERIFLGSFFSLLPDLLTLMYWTFKENIALAKVKTFHAFAHRYSRFPKYSPERQWTWRNARNDILISLFTIFILFLL
ncbi:MAG: hypothetical protein A2288_00645 [Candidatus Moranbacteria bacterium RIFOXYA12_FULL_44_15]|nr:MAG: hypothetical protein A2288_00645 [Candidatus Moranbacteria bacterium RIFOXYA12_FULL_44_15]OGI36524.1 MAG: hypothetical protein A2259_02870 [Candidatus Moranbacteria bacterium RIFOXYA2_FULL_43_15]